MWSPLPFNAALAEYEQQAAVLLAGWRDGHAEARRTFRERHPRFLDGKIPWLPKRLSEQEEQAIEIGVEDARLTLARCYCFQDWSRLAEFVSDAAAPGSAVSRFEASVEAVIDGRLDELAHWLKSDGQLIHARSTRVTNFDPARHQATLLHYLAANGVEGYRQRSPANAVEVARLLLAAGAEPDALAGFYGGECTTLSLLVSGSPPAAAGVQTGLIEALLDAGASLDERGSGNWTSPLITALVFGFQDAAETLVRRGARVDRLAAAAGLGQLEPARSLLLQADALERHRALALASQLGHASIVRLLVEAGEDPNRYNPPGFHQHATPLHHAALNGRLETVRMLVEQGARLDIEDAIYRGTPLGWAEHAGQSEVAAFLRTLA